MKVKGKILNLYSILNESIIYVSPQITDEANVSCFLCSQCMYQLNVACDWLDST